jgi:cutinase
MLGPAASPALASTPATCSDVYVLFARGTAEPGTLGIVVGPDFASAVKSNLAGKTVTIWGDPYAASITQLSAGPGATLMTDELDSVASDCPDAQFVLGGYSQGASVVDISLGIPTLLGTGATIPSSLSSSIAAIVTWGNPLSLFLHETIGMAKPVFADRTKEYCNQGDPVCGNGFDVLAHLLYGVNGDAAAGGAFAADEVLADS